MSLSIAQYSAGSRTNTSNISALASNAFTATSGKIYVAFLVFTDDETNPEAPTTVALSGATPPTVTQVGPVSASYSTLASPLHRMTAWWFIGDGVSRTLTATQPDTGTGYIWYMMEITDGDTSSPFAQTVANAGNAGTTASATLSTFASESHIGVIAAASSQNVAVSAEAGGAWTELGSDASIATPAARMSVAARTPGTDTSPSMTFGSTVDWGCIALEVKAAPAGVSGHFGVLIG